MKQTTRTKLGKIISDMSDSDLSELVRMATDQLDHRREVRNALTAITYRVGDTVDVILSGEGWKPCRVIRVNKKTLSIEVLDGTGRTGRVGYGSSIRKRG